ncbi:MAG: Cof-type HAD-IIB family hydrolase [Erysipelotrichaceae bacterium]|nr:Cof-type HAD-IIB family hydrolase [Erysipelotrichaceae bacterium]
MRRRYFFFDIDGTLTDNRTHRVVPSARQAIHELQEAGHFTAIATGRAYYKTKGFAESVGIDNIVCCGGGALVIDGVLIENQPLDHEKAVRILRHADAEGIGWVVMRRDSDSVVMRDYRFLEQAGLRKELTTYLYEPEYDYEAEDILKIYLACTAENEPEWINELGHLRLSRNYVVFQYDAKKDGIIRMLRHLNADLCDAVVFGDDLNDLVMFDPAWTSIAMGNAKPELKEKADYVTDANVDDGIRNACLKFGWIRQ